MRQRRERLYAPGRWYRSGWREVRWGEGRADVSGVEGGRLTLAGGVGLSASYASRRALSSA